MKIVDPKVYVLASTQLESGIVDYLVDNQIAWRPDHTVSGAENLAEFAGRICYRSWAKEDGTFENKNLSKVREGNELYISNIIKSKHGSVCEHGSVTFLLTDVTRVLTHELVRHRVGTAYSQTSGRYVRCDDISIYIPEIIKENDQATKVFTDITIEIENAIKELEKIYGIDSIPDFATKKLLTSAFRRIAPNGMTNDIVFTANHRTIRFVIQQRTANGAEIEIRIVFDAIARLMKERFPNLYQDMNLNEDGEWVFDCHKI